MLDLALLLLLQPNPDAIRRLFEENLARRQNAQAARDLGLFLKQQGDEAGARAALLQAVSMDEKESGRASDETLRDAAELAAVSPPGEAEPLWRRAAESGNASLSSRALAALAEIAAAREDRAGAAVLLRRALAKEEEAAGKDSAGVAVRLNSLAALVPPREGIPMLERALGIDRRLSGDRHPETATTLANLAGVYLEAGRTDEALRAAITALAIFQETLGPDHPRTAAACTVAAFCWRDKGNRARAEELFRRALAIDTKAYGPRHPETLEDVRNLAGFLRATGRAGEAGELEKRLR